MLRVDVAQALYEVEAVLADSAAAQGLPAPGPVVPPYGPGDWPPDYRAVLAWRRQQLARFEKDPQLLADARAYYAGGDLGSPPDPAALSERVVAFVCHWCDTYDPRLIGTGRSPRMPLVLFGRQVELVEFVVTCMLADAPGLIEKSRDMGATWVCGAVTTWGWNFLPGFVAGWGSNKSDQVDVLGNPKSIFEKLRMLILGLPPPLRPDVSRGVDLKQHTCRNPENGSVIDGEIGRNIGRGGRSRIYFVDEAAHLEDPESVEASLSENTRCRIDISSVSGPNTVFYRKRVAGKEWSRGQPVRRDVANVFVMDWSEHPEKTKQWYTDRRAYFEAQGTPAIVAREIDRDYMGAAEGVIIKYEWAEAAVDAHVKLGFDDSGGWWGGLDLADEGPDANALVRGRGVVVKHAEEITGRDPGAVARRVFGVCYDTRPIILQYDVGGGFGGSVKSEFNRLQQDEGADVRWLTLVPWDAAARVLDPGDPVLVGDADSPTNRNFFENFKAQAWWNVAQMFRRTWQAVNGEAEYDPADLISIDSSTIPGPVLTKLLRELAQATMGHSGRLKMLVNKAPDGAKSPNLADGLIMGRYPARGPPRQLVATMFGPEVIYG